MWQVVVFVLIIYAVICEQLFPTLGLISAVIGGYLFMAWIVQGDPRLKNLKLPMWFFPLTVSLCVGIYLRPEEGMPLTWPPVILLVIGYVPLMVWGYHANPTLFRFYTKVIPTAMITLAVTSYLTSFETGRAGWGLLLVEFSVLAFGFWICFQFYKQYKRA